MLNWVYTVFSVLLAGMAMAQKPMVQLMVDPKVCHANQQFTVTVKYNINGSLSVDLPAAAIQGNSTMSMMEQEMDYSTGKIITYNYDSRTVAIGKEGTFTIGPAYIKKGSKVYKSNVVTIKIENDKPEVTVDINSKSLKKPAFGFIEKSKTKIFEGEPLVLSAKVYSHFEPTHFENYLPFEIEGAIEKHELGNSQQIMTERVNVRGMMMYYFENERQVVFPTTIGKILINPFKMTLKSGIDGYSFVSNGAYIEVVPLPANPPKDFIGGVGKFSFASSVDKTDYKQGDVMVMTVVVSGSGNLHNINNPKIILPKGMIQYGDPVIQEDYSFGVNGAEGKITYQFNIQMMKAGDFDMPDLSLSYFDPNKQQYVTISEKGVHVHVTKNAKFNNTVIPEKVDNVTEETIALSPSKEFRKSRNINSIVDSPLFTVALASPLFFALLFLFFKIRRDKNAVENQTLAQQKLAKAETWKELETAEVAFKSGNSELFYSSIYKAIIKLCKAELNLDTGLSLSKNELFSYLMEKNISSDNMEELRKVIQQCEEARYGLAPDASLQSQILHTTKELMQSISDQLKRNR